jgi:hypothetical protein
MPDIVTARTFVDGEKNITAQKLNDIVASSVIQPAFVSAKPPASTVAPTDNLLVLTAAGSYAKAPFQTVIDSVNAGLNTDGEIWSVRQRSFNSVGNSVFEIDQRRAGGLAPGSIATGLFLIDRWAQNHVGTMQISGQQINQSAFPATPIVVPGTNFRISNSCLTCTLTTQETTLGSGDGWRITQTIEGSQFRELIGDVHSVSLLVNTSVAGLKFGVALRDPAPSTRTLTKLCTVPNANTWTLITLPNIPVWSSGGAFGMGPGAAGYELHITLAAGSTLTSPANDTWQNGSYIGAAGQSNFAASPVNSTFLVAMVQHEPGPVCSTPMDCSFQQAYESALRYFQKTWNYGTAPPTATTVGARSWIAPGAVAYAMGPTSFLKPMAKVPNMTIYNTATAVAGSIRDGLAVDHTGANPNGIGDSGFYSMGFTTATTAMTYLSANYIADTGW